MSLGGAGIPHFHRLSLSLIHESEDPRSKEGTSCRADTYSVIQTRSPTLSGKEKAETADYAACCCLVNLQEGMFRALGPHGEHFSTCAK